MDLQKIRLTGITQINSNDEPGLNNEDAISWDMYEILSGLLLSLFF